MKQATPLLVHQGLRYLLSVLLTAILGRILLPEQMGLLAIVTTVFALAHLLMDLGSGAMATSTIAEDRSRERPILESLQTARLRIAAVVSLLLLAAALLSGHGQTQRICFLAAVVMMVLPLGTWGVAFAVRGRFWPPTWISLSLQALVVVAATLISDPKSGGWTIILLLILREGLQALSIGFFGRRFSRDQARVAVGSEVLFRFWKRTRIYALTTVCQAFYFYADVALVRFLAGEEALGAYSAAYRPIHPLLVVPGAFLLPLLAPWSSMASGGTASSPLWGQVRTWSRRLGLLGVAAGIAGALAAPFIIELLYDGGYASHPLDAVPAMRWLFLAMAAVFGGAAFHTALLSIKATRKLLWTAVLGLLINVVGNIIMIPRMGIEGAALMTAATEVFTSIAAWVLVRSSLDARDG